MLQQRTKQSALEPMDMRALARILIEHEGIEEGHYQVMVDFVFNTGLAGPSRDEMYPTAFAGIKSLRLVKVDEPTPISVDAASLQD